MPGRWLGLALPSSSRLFLSSLFLLLFLLLGPPIHAVTWKGNAQRHSTPIDSPSTTSTFAHESFPPNTSSTSFLFKWVRIDIRWAITHLYGHVGQTLLISSCHFLLGPYYQYRAKEDTYQHLSLDSSSTPIVRLLEQYGQNNIVRLDWRGSCRRCTWFLPLWIQSKVNSLGEISTFPRSVPPLCLDITSRPTAMAR